MSFTEQVRNAIRKSGQTRYRLARASGGRLHESELSRFLSGRGNLGLPKLDIVAELVGLSENPYLSLGGEYAGSRIGRPNRSR